MTFETDASKYVQGGRNAFLASFGNGTVFGRLGRMQ